jgi:hypothetical protein
MIPDKETMMTTNNMQAVLDKQRVSFTAALPEPMSVRRDRIDRAIALLTIAVVNKR